MILIMKGSSSEEELDSSDFTTEESSEEDALAKGAIDFERDLNIIEGLKFQNTVYKPKDDIALRLDPKTKKLAYGKILVVAKAPSVKFPIVRVAWYYSKYDGFEEDEIPSHLGDRELVLTDHKDWNYTESIVRKIKVLPFKQYQTIESREKQSPVLFYRRSCLYTKLGKFISEPPKVCHCLVLYNPDFGLKRCLLCGFRFHPQCVRNSDICLICQ